MDPSTSVAGNCFCK